MVLKLYYDPVSQPSRALYLLLKMNEIPFEEVVVSISKAEHKTTDFMAVNPFRNVPAIDHDGFKLTESVAILRYLCRTFPVADHWYPSNDSKIMAKVDEYMSWQHLNIRLLGSMTFLTTTQPINFAVEYFALFGGTREENLPKFKTFLDHIVGAMEQTWLKDKAFVAGDEITIADLLCVVELEQPRNAGYDIKQTHPKIAEYMDRVTERLEPHYSNVRDKALKMVDELKMDPALSNYSKYM